VRVLLLLAAASCLYAAPAFRLANSVVGPISVAVGQNPESQTITAYNFNVNDSPTLTLSIPETVTWLTATVGNVTPCTALSQVFCALLHFNLNTASLPAGSYTAAVSVSDPRASDSTQVVTVTVFVGGGPPAIDVEMTPGTVADFRFPGAALSCPRGCSLGAATAVNGGDWLTAMVVTDSASTISLSWHWQIRLSPPVGMPDRTYQAILTVTDSVGEQTIPVTMRIGGSVPVFASPDHLAVRVADGGPPVTAPFLPHIRLATPDSVTVPAKGVTTFGSGISATISDGAVIVTVDPTGLSPWVNGGHITIDCDKVGCPIDVPVSLQIVPKGPPQIANEGVSNNATFNSYATVAPGEVMVMKGEQLSNSPAVFATTTPLPPTLGGVSVTVEGVVTPLYYSSAGQVAFQMPYNTNTGIVHVQLFRDGQPSNTATVTAVPRAPQIVVITGADYTPRDATHPAQPGESLIVWAIGLGRTNPVVLTGTAAPSNPPAVVDPPPFVAVGPQTLPPEFAGLAPGQVGLYQIIFAVPASTQPGLLAIVIGFANETRSDPMLLAIR
jgi:uncharacterized protein (TIGR03437 family)